MVQTIHIEEEMKKFTDYFAEAKDYPKLLQDMAIDPIEVLKTMDIPVTDQFRDAVIQQMQTVAEFSLLQREDGESQLRTSAEVPNDVTESLEFSVQPWGLVLTVGEPAIKYLQGGGAISSGTLGTIATTAGLFFPGIGLAMALAAAALGIFLGVITITDEGKGVYLTWTWAQFLPWLLPPLIPNPMYGIPVVTPIK